MSIRLVELAVIALSVVADTPAVSPDSFNLACDDGSQYRIDVKHEMWCQGTCTELKTFRYRGGPLLDLVVSEHSGVRFDMKRRKISVGSDYPGSDVTPVSHPAITRVLG